MAPDISKRFERRGLLLLEDGSIFEGWGFGSSCLRTGEVVFSTGMVGYVESLTDPSYRGQILVQTYPSIGNYGVTSTFTQSDRIQVRGYVIRDPAWDPSHWSSSKSLDHWLAEEGIPGIWGLDTRALTKRLREKGTMLGLIYSLGQDEEPDKGKIDEALRSMDDPNKSDLVAEVAAKQKRTLGKGGRPRIAIYDLGIKRSTIRSLLERGAELTLLPRETKPEELLDDRIEGVLVSNGPGDPRNNKQLIQFVATLASEGIPLMGICLGHQVIALAMGCDSFKMKFGHRGVNHPVTSLADGRLVITSQNHGFAIEESSVSGTGLEVTRVHSNDKTIEGFRHSRSPIITTQYHPEAAPGPRDADSLFDEFLRLVKGNA